MKHFVLLALRKLNGILGEGQSKHALRRFILRHRPYIPRELLINPGDCVVQVGTPNKQTVERISKAVGSSGRVVVIEPMNSGPFLTHIRTHALGNVDIIQKAAWSEAGSRELLVSDIPGDHRLANESVLHDNDFRGDGYTSTTRVAVDTIDNIMRATDIHAIDFIEIAVNGAEHHVLKGMSTIILETNRLFLKGHARDRESGDPINVAIAKDLRSKGFETHVTLPTPSVAKDWGDREGDVYAFRSR